MTSALRWAAMRAILMFQWEVTDKVTGQRPQTTAFWKRKESGSGYHYQTEVLPLTSLTALQLGQTGPQILHHTSQPLINYEQQQPLMTNAAQRVTIFTAVQIRKPPTAIRRATVPIRIHGPLFAQPCCQ